MEVSVTKKKTSNTVRYVFIITDSDGYISSVFKSSCKACMTLRKLCDRTNGTWVEPTFDSGDDVFPHFVYTSVGRESDVVVRVKKYRVL